MRVLTILLIALLFAAAQAKDEATQYLSLKSQGINRLVAECGAGFLKVEGEKDLDEIQVTAEIIPNGVSKKELKEGLKLSLEKEGDTARLISKFDHEGLVNWIFGSGNVEINLTVKVPAKMNLDIKDGSGSMEIKNSAGAVQVHDGSGDMTLQNISGKLKITDGSGGIELKNIGGSCDITDGSGPINIEQVMGDVNMTDGSGSIELDKINGNVDITDGSGGMTLRHITGTVTLRDGSGDIRANYVGGDFIIESDGSGGVYTDHIKGKVIGKRN